MTTADTPRPAPPTPIGRAPSAFSPTERSRRERAAIRRAQAHLLSLQNADGHWCGELEGDSILESEYLMTLYFLGRQDEPRFAKVARHLRDQQLPEGGWGLFPGGAADVNPTVKAYFALKLAGDPADAPHMRAAREVARRLGGTDACNSFTKIYLAIFGQYPWSGCPAVPPELVLLPDWVPFNIYEMSSWSRAIVVPLSIVRALRPACPVPQEAAIPELRVTRGTGPPRTGSLSTAAWRRFFRLTDAVLRFYERRPLRGVRQRALTEARDWTVRHFEGSDGLGAIFPPIINSILALRALGAEDDDPLLSRQIEELEKLGIEEESAARLQPCLSPVWDTALALNALVDSGVDGEAPPVGAAVGWLVDREVSRLGDWARGVEGATPAGWYFEYANEFYPDCDDTSQVVTALTKIRCPDEALRERVDGAVDRAARWLRAMQNRDGGWGAFDRDCDREFLTHIPFADHNAMIDPATVDVTARVVEALLRAGEPRGSETLRRAVGFIYRRQEKDGSWYGRWGCNYIYGTWLALWALRHAGEAPSTPAIRQAASWLTSCQNADGGWGELPESYARPETKGQGPSTASQTAWALLGLMAAGDERSPAVAAGIDYLLHHQETQGGWSDSHWTGTGFPEVFYLRYHLYPTYFPLLTLATHSSLAAGRDPFAPATEAALH